MAEAVELALPLLPKGTHSSVRNVRTSTNVFELEASTIKRALRSKTQRKELESLEFVELTAGGDCIYKKLSREGLYEYVKALVASLPANQQSLLSSSSSSSLTRDPFGILAQKLDISFDDIRSLIHPPIYDLNGKVLKGPSMSPTLSPILVRKHVILFNFDFFPGFLLQDRIILILPVEGDVLSMLQNIVVRKSGEGVLFEIAALEGILDTICNFLKDEFSVLWTKTKPVLDRIGKTRFSAEEAERFNSSKGYLSTFQARVDLVFNALDSILRVDSDMALMNLSKIATNSNFFQNQSLELHPLVCEIRLIFELNLHEARKVKTLVHLGLQEIHYTEMSANMKLDAARNELLFLTTLFDLLTFLVGIGGAVAGIFGMNLFEHPSDTWFGITLLLLVVFLCLTFVLVRIYLRRQGLWVY